MSGNRLGAFWIAFSANNCSNPLKKISYQTLGSIRKYLPFKVSMNSSIDPIRVDNEVKDAVESFVRISELDKSSRDEASFLFKLVISLSAFSWAIR